MCTPVYIKMDAKDQLLLSEGVCNQLHIITYHSTVTDAQLDVTHQHMPAVIVPCVRVKLLQTVRIPPFQSKNVPVQLEGTTTPNQSFLIEPCELYCSHKTKTVYCNYFKNFTTYLCLRMVNETKLIY